MRPEGQTPIRGVLVTAIFIALLAFPVAAAAQWQQTGSGSGYAKGNTMPAGNKPEAKVEGRNVTVKWTASVLSGGGSPSGYVVKRFDTSGVEQTIKSACSGTIAATSCTEKAVPSGSWRYSVTPVLGSWLGKESERSETAIVGSPTLTLTPTTVTSLPSTLTGEIANFVEGQTVSFRLDNPTSGQVLEGSIEPTPVQANGKASVSVKIPSGVSNGSHTVYAIGSAGDQASASITVSVGTTISTSAWDLRDASSGTEQNSSALTAFVDERPYETGKFLNKFETSRYIEWTYNSPLQSSVAVSSAKFNFRFRSNGGAEVACFWFEVISGGTKIGEHGSKEPGTATSEWCSGSTYKTVSTSLPEVTTGALANGVHIKVYGYESNSNKIWVDQATVTGTASSQEFTLQEITQTDSATGTPTTTPWSLAAESDSVFYTSLSNWESSFKSTRFVKFTFPGSYVPATATVNSVKFKHSYRSTGGEVCLYFQVYSGATLLGTYGSEAAPLSCNNSTTTFKTTETTLEPVPTVAQVNNLTVKMFVRNAEKKKSVHDLALLTITYVP